MFDISNIFKQLGFLQLVKYIGEQYIIDTLTYYSILLCYNINIINFLRKVF